MILLADFGNTRVKMAVPLDGEMQIVYSGPVLLDDIRKSVAQYDISGGMWCAVCAVPDTVTAWMQELGMAELTHKTAVPLENAYQTPQTLGMDRLAAAVGAWSMKPGNNILVVDAGTAITLDLVSARGVYMGGNISPGINLRLKALHEYTGALPLVEAEGKTPAFGYNTQTAVRSGVVRGVRNELLGYIKAMEPEYPSLLIFLTGGDTDFFDIRGKKTIFAVPDLVFRGMARILEFNESSN